MDQTTSVFEYVLLLKKDKLIIFHVTVILFIKNIWSVNGYIQISVQDFRRK